MSEKQWNDFKKFLAWLIVLGFLFQRGKVKE